jgi:hypothetical protein
MAVREAKVLEEAEELSSPALDLEKLRAELGRAIESLDRGEGREIDIEDVIKRARQR